MSEARIKILEKTLVSKLDDYFDIIPKELYEKAEEQAFEGLEYDECTEDQCIMKIKELLQVENVFNMQLVENDGDIQLSLTWVGLEGKKVLKDFCEGCKNEILNTKIELLVKNLVQQIGQVVKVDVESKASDTISKTETAKDDIKDDSESKETLAVIAELYTYKLRGIIGSGSTEKTKFNNMSLHFIWERLGIGLSYFYMKDTSSAEHKYELHNQSLDLSYTYVFDYSFSFLAGVIVDGEAKSTTLNLKSTAVSGYRVMGLVGADFGKWEFLGGYQYSTFQYKNFTISKNLNLFGGLMVFGIGLGF